MAEEGMSNKIGNVMGVPIPVPVRNQLHMRASKNASLTIDRNSNQLFSDRDDDNIKYLANKSSFVRLVSSVNVESGSQQFFAKLLPENLAIQDSTSLAKYFVLSGGTSIYEELEGSNFRYTQRAGLQDLQTNTDAQINNGAYGMLGINEVKKYGYRPMPGITDAKITTQGRLGSVRQATISFKVWDKDQLDIIDALYFKMGYLMFLEWGHVMHYDNTGKLVSIGSDMIDPFKKGLDKETLNHLIAEKVENSNGNYDAMLGMCTQFNFDFNQDGGFDCTIKLIGLGALADAMKLNHASKIPSLNEDEISSYYKLFTDIKLKEERAKIAAAAAANPAPVATPPAQLSINQYIVKYAPTLTDTELVKYTIPTYNTATANTNTEGVVTLPDSAGASVQGLYYRKLGIYIPTTTSASSALYKKFLLDNAQWRKYISAFFNPGTKNPIDAFQDSYNDQSQTIIYLTSADKKSDLQIRLSPQEDVPCRIIGNATLVSPINQKEYQINFEIPVIGPIVYSDPFGTSNPWSFSTIYDSNDSDKAYNAPPLEGATKPTNEHITWLKILVKNLLYQEVARDHSTTLLATVAFSKPSMQLRNPSGPGVAAYAPVTGITSEKNNSYSLSLRITVETKNLGFFPDTTSTGAATTVKKIGNFSEVLTVTIYNDASIISGVEFADESKALLEYKNKSTAAATDAANKKAAADAAQAESDLKAKVEAAVKNESITYNSGLEIFLRSIQLHSLNSSIGAAGTSDIRSVKEVDLSGNYIKQLFNKGLFADCIDKFGIDKDNSGTKDLAKGLDPGASARDRFVAYATYGFNHNMMSSKDPKDFVEKHNLKQCNFYAMFTSWVMPYDINQPVLKDVDINHPVYIRLDLLLFAINHMCMLYDSPKSPDGKSAISSNQKPIVYIDFNEYTNTCLSMPLQLSIDILKFMIPFRATDAEYRLLFEDELVLTDGTSKFIKKGPSEASELLKPQTEDFISRWLPNFKNPENSTSGAWQGQIMKVLVNVDYVLNLCQSFVNKDDSHAVNLRPLIQQMLSDMMKSMGDVNLFRFAYNDAGNCLYIIDDQSSPLQPGEKYAREDAYTQRGIELPLFGLNSIAKSLSIKTEVSTKLSNMLAISANSDKKADSGKDATPFGQYNKDFSDRYKPQVLSIDSDVQTATAGEMKAAAMFNDYVKSILSTDKPQVEGTSQAINYYIERMNKKKSEKTATQSSAMIPVSVDFTTNGISGLAMGHAFTLPDELLPNSYSRFNDSEGKRIGFVVIGLEHSIQGNLWDTSVKANMMFLKDAQDFKVDKSSFNINDLATGDVAGEPEVITNNQSGANTMTSTTPPSGAPTATATGCKTSYKDLTIQTSFTANLMPYADAAKYLKSNHPAIAKAVFAVLTAEAAKSGQNFRSAGGFNYGGVQTDCGKWGFSNFVAQFCRVDSGGKQRMFAVFADNNGFLDFMANRLTSKGFSGSDGDAWTNTYINKWWSPEAKATFTKGTTTYNSKLSIYNTAAKRFDSLA